MNYQTHHIISLAAFVMLNFFTSSCKSDPKFIRVDRSEVDQRRLAFATTISNDILMAQKEGGFYAFKVEEATEKMLSSLDESLQRKSYQQLKGALGDYQDLSLYHMMKPNDGTSYEIYRFNENFKPGVKVEIRTVLDANGKLAGFFVKPWNNNL